MGIIMNLRVLFRSTGLRTIALEVVNQRLRVVSQVTEVNSLTTLAKEQQPVESLEQFGGRLMDAKRSS